jgi:hypothetical protein
MLRAAATADEATTLAAYRSAIAKIEISASTPASARH